MVDAKLVLVGSLVVLAGCPLPVHVGDNPLESSAGDSQAEASEDSGEAPVTGSGEAEPGVCGDGVVGVDEVCDDGNDDAEDGCDAACARTGNVQWTRQPGGIWTDVAVDADGRVIVVGPGRVLALGDDGETLWEQAMDDADANIKVAVDDQRRIYAAALTGVIHSFAPDGALRWKQGETTTGGIGIADVTARGEVLYAIVNKGAQSPESQIILRVHSLESGELIASETSSAGITAVAESIAVSGTHVVAVGFGSTDDEPPYDTRKMVAIYDLEGAAVSFDLGNEVDIGWRSVAATSDGGFILTTSGPHVGMRRLAANLQAKWDQVDEGFFGSWVNGTAAGPGEVFAVVGRGKLENNAGFVRRYTGAGEGVWASAFGTDEEFGMADATAVAFGPDFLVAIGDTDGAPWVRRFAIE